MKKKRNEIDFELANFGPSKTGENKMRKTRCACKVFCCCGQQEVRLTWRSKKNLFLWIKLCENHRSVCFCPTTAQPHWIITTPCKRFCFFFFFRSFFYLPFDLNLSCSGLVFYGCVFEPFKTALASCSCCQHTWTRTNHRVSQQNVSPKQTHWKVPPQKTKRRETSRQEENKRAKRSHCHMPRLCSQLVNGEHGITRRTENLSTIGRNIYTVSKDV